MDLTFGHSPWILLLSIIVAGGLGWWSYQETIPSISIPKRFLLGSLRFLSLSIVLALLFEPLWQHESELLSEPVIALLIDDSESMAMADSLVGDSGPDTNEIVNALVRETRGMDVRLFSFGNNLQTIDSLGALTRAQSRTDISGALLSVSDELSDENFGALILASDGLFNSGTNPIHVADRYAVPIITVTHGDSTAHKDLRIVDVVSNEIVYAGTIVPVRVRLRNEGYAGGRLTVNLYSGSSVIDGQTIELAGDGSEVILNLEFEAKDVGRAEYQVSVSRFPEEATYRNNVQNLTVQVLDQKKSILIIAGAPSPDVSALTRLLLADDTAEIATFVQSNRGSFYEGDLPEDLSEFDLILSVGFPGPASSPADSRRIVTAIEGGVPLLFVLDKRTNLSSLARDFSGVIPVSPEALRPSFVAGTFLQSPNAASHAIFDIADRRDGSLWRRLPPLSINESRWSASPGATVLATTEIRGIAFEDPLFVVGRRGKVKSAALLAHGFWKWSLAPDDLDSDVARFKTLFGNLVQWLYASDDHRLVRVRPSEREYAEGEAVVLRGEVYDESLRPISEASLSLRLRSPEGQMYPYELQPQGNGRYRVDIGSLPVGTYAYTATGTRDDAEIGTDSGSFTIGRRTLEFRRTRADFNIMSQIALRSGGVSFSSSQIEGIRAHLESLPSLAPTNETVLEQSRLWQLYPAMVLILVLLSVEWFFRKRFGMV